MGRSHLQELEAIPATLAWSAQLDLSSWEPAISGTLGRPAIMVASGGSYSAAVLLAQLHIQRTGQIALAVTPLEFLSMDCPASAAIWLISAGGNNKDILAALDAAQFVPGAVICVFCGDQASQLVRRVGSVEKAETLVFSPPFGKDGFLATNSLIAQYVISLRLFGYAVPGAASLEESGADERALLERQTLIILYDGWLKATALDIESRFSEAALGNVQVCDYRNFAHGRHHWLAKRGVTSAVLGLVSPRCEALAQATFREFPLEVATHLWNFDDDGPLAALQGLLRSTRLAFTAARRIALDPGRPGVPDFGRRIYDLGPLRKISSHPAAWRQLAIERKSGLSAYALRQNGLLASWEESLDQFIGNLKQGTFVGVVLDYDGTVVATRQRFEPITDLVKSELTRVLAEGMRIGIATGRGKSVWKEMRAAISQEYWDRVTIGYYNSSVIKRLDEDVADIASGDVAESLMRCKVAIEGDDELRTDATCELRPTQLTITAHHYSEEQLWRVTSQVIARAHIDGVKIVHSSHSVDVIESTCSKCNLIPAVRGKDSNKVLKIGDRGRWPGNDSEMLDMEFALSVDEPTRARDTGWNLLSNGVSGSRGLAIYLSCLRAGTFELDRLFR